MSLIENAKDAVKLVQQIGNSELYEKLIALQSDALAMADENWNLKEQVRSLEQQLEEQKKLLDVTEDMEYVEDGGFYVRKSERDNGKSISYCPLCFKSDGKIVPLYPDPGFNRGCYKCGLHNERYETAACRERKLAGR